MLHSQWRHLTNRSVSTRNVSHGLYNNRDRYSTILENKRQSETKCRWIRRILSTHLSPAPLVNAEDSAISTLTAYKQASTETQQDDMMAEEGGHCAAYHLVARTLRKHSPRPSAPPTNYPCVLVVLYRTFAASKVDRQPTPDSPFKFNTNWTLRSRNRKKINKEICWRGVIDNCWTRQNNIYCF